MCLFELRWVYIYTRVCWAVDSSLCVHGQVVCLVTWSRHSLVTMNMCCSRYTYTESERVCIYLCLQIFYFEQTYKYVYLFFLYAALFSHSFQCFMIVTTNHIKKVLYLSCAAWLQWSIEIKVSCSVSASLHVRVWNCAHVFHVCEDGLFEWTQQHIFAYMGGRGDCARDCGACICEGRHRQIYFMYDDDRYIANDSTCCLCIVRIDKLYFCQIIELQSAYVFASMLTCIIIVVQKYVIIIIINVHKNCFDTPFYRLALTRLLHS